MRFLMAQVLVFQCRLCYGLLGAYVVAAVDIIWVVCDCCFEIVTSQSFNARIPNHYTLS